MKKVIIKKGNKFKVFYLKIKNALFKNQKLVIVNNYNVLNVKSKELNKTLKTKLINNNVIRGLKLEFPVSGLSKIIKFHYLSELNNNLVLLENNKTFFDTVLVKIYNQIYNLTKLSTLLVNNFVKNKKKFLVLRLTNYVTNLNFLHLHFFSISVRFFTLLKMK